MKKCNQSGAADEKKCNQSGPDDEKNSLQAEGNYKLLSKYINIFVNSSNLTQCFSFLIRNTK